MAQGDAKQEAEWEEGRRRGIFHPKDDRSAGVSAETKEKHGTTAGKDLGAAGKGGAGMPKQSDYATTSEWATAMRKWRAEGSGDEKAAGQKRALERR